MLYSNQNKIQGIALGLAVALVLAPSAVVAESSPSPLKLAQAQVAAKQDGQAWIKKGDQLRSAGKHEEALQAYRKAESLGAGSDQLTFTIGDTYKEMGRERDAYWEFSKADNSKNHESRMVACEQMEELKYARNKYFKDPYFADLSTTAGWNSIGDTAYVDVLARYGRYIGEDAEVYGYAGLARDNRSGLSGGFPEEYYDNLARIGVGARKYLTEGLSVMAEAGAARDLIDKNRSRSREDFRAGFEYYRNWNMDYDCRSTDTRPNRFILSVDSELKYYSLYDDAVYFNLTVRPGIRLVETRKTDVDAFLHLAYGTNLEDSSEAYSELAVGARWLPNRNYDFAVEVRTGRVFYDEGGSESSSVIEFQHYVSW